MALGLTPEHLELAAAVRGWAQRHCPADVVRAAVDADDSGAGHYRAALAPNLAEQGLFGLHLPEDAGGQGFGLPELAVALEETGQGSAPRRLSRNRPRSRGHRRGPGSRRVGP